MIKFFKILLNNLLVSILFNNNYLIINISNILSNGISTISTYFEMFLKYWYDLLPEVVCFAEEGVSA